MSRSVRKLSPSRIAVGALLLVVAWSVGCASSQTRADEADRRVEGTPPSQAEAAEEASMPESPPVYVGETQLASDSDASSGAETSVSSTTGPTVEREQLKALLEKGPAHVLQAVQVEPLHRDGQFRGFEIKSMSDAAGEAVGPELQVGDVLTHLEGNRLKKPQDYLSVWKKLGELSEITIEYLRDGEPSEVTWTVVR